MTIQTTIDLDRLRELIGDPAAATDEQLLEAASLIPSTSIHFGQPSPELHEFSFNDLMLISDVLHQAALRGLEIPRSLVPEV